MKIRLPTGAIVLGLILVFGSLGACSWLPEVKDETGNWSVERLYNTGRESVQEGNYLRATKLFESLESRFPYGPYAQQALLQLAYANYKMSELAAAISAADRFIKQYPNHPNVDYAYYLRGLANFNEDFGFLTWLADQDLSERDPKTLKESYASFRDLVAKFPESRYAGDSRARMNFLVNALATGEVHVARYYYNRGAYIAAATRAQSAVLTYPTAPITEDALYLMISAYDKMQLEQLRDDARRILEKNYPKSKYLVGNTAKSWWKFW